MNQFPEYFEIYLVCRKGLEGESVALGFRPFFDKDKAQAFIDNYLANQKELSHHEFFLLPLDCMPHDESSGLVEETVKVERNRLVQVRRDSSIHNHWYVGTAIASDGEEIRYRGNNASTENDTYNRTVEKLNEHERWIRLTKLEKLQELLKRDVRIAGEDRQILILTGQLVVELSKAQQVEKDKSERRGIPQPAEFPDAPPEPYRSGPFPKPGPFPPKPKH